MTLVEDFLRHLRGARRLSKHTLRAYGGDLRRFVQFLGGEDFIATGRPGVVTSHTSMPARSGRPISLTSSVMVPNRPTRSHRSAAR